MKVTSKKPKGQRFFKSVYLQFENGYKTKRPFHIEPVENGWWFCLRKGQWEKGYNGKGGMSSSYYAMTRDGFNNAYSLKAVKRLIAKWDVPKGTKFRASLPFVGHDFFLTKYANGLQVGDSAAYHKYKHQNTQAHSGITKCRAQNFIRITNI